MLSGTEVPDLVEMLEGSLGFFTRGPREDIGLLDLTDRIRAENLEQRMVASRFSLWTARGRIYALPHDVHPVMLAYRRDLVEALGIDVSELDTWEKFVTVGRRITRDRDGDGVIDQYMLDLPYAGDWAVVFLLAQRGGQIFDEHGEVAFNSELTVDTILWYLRQTYGPHKIAYDCSWGQPRMKIIADGVALFFWAADWLSYMYQEELPRLKGKLALMPLPAWHKGGRRTTVWGGTGLSIARRTRNPDLAWDLARFLYLDPKELGQRFAGTNIIPPLKDAWNLPEFDRPSPFYSNQPLGRLYANLAPETPPFYSAPVDTVARVKLNEAFSRSLEHYKAHGENGLREKIQQELGSAAEYVTRIARRNQALLGKE
jgi:arabinosaccharide transport system substrate-binding protein